MVTVPELPVSPVKVVELSSTVILLVLEVYSKYASPPVTLKVKGLLVSESASTAPTVPEAEVPPL